MQSETSRKLRHYQVANIILSEMRLATIQETKEILAYQNGVYHRGAVFRILRRIQEIMEDDCTSHFRNEVLEQIRVKANIQSISSIQIRTF